MLLSQADLTAIDAELTHIVTRLYHGVKEGEEFSFENVYLIGKLVTHLGDESHRKMPFPKALAEARRLGIYLTPEDKAILKGLKSQTDIWVASMSGEMDQRVRALLLQAEAEWATELVRRDSKAVLMKSRSWDRLREEAVESLRQGMRKVLDLFEGVVDRFLQTEVAKFFQRGQVSEVSPEEEIYKLPRPQACQHCMRLHLERDGSPKIYRLRDVQGSTNVGKKPAAWTFVLGPVHPHCYCTLYRVSKRPPAPSELMANARAESLAVGLKRRREILAEAQSKLQEALSQSQ